MTTGTKTLRFRLIAIAAGVMASAGALTASTVSPLTASAGKAAPTSSSQTTSAYTPGSRDDAQNARLADQLGQALAAKRQGARAAVAATTVYYDASNAPSFASQIANSAAIWNSSVRNVRLVAGSPASLTYYEGSDPRGSYASTDGHGSGYILIDYSQAQQYNPLRIVAHETGHVLGLPDHYSGPCSELMSGGGPGPSCTNPYPNSTESYQVDALWAYGFAAASTPVAAAFGSQTR